MAWSSKYLKQLGTNNKLQVSDWEWKAKKLNTKQSLDPLLIYHIFKDSSCPWEARHRGVCGTAPVEGWGLRWQLLQTRSWWDFHSNHNRLSHSFYSGCIQFMLFPSPLNVD